MGLSSDRSGPNTGVAGSPKTVTANVATVRRGEKYDESAIA